MTLKLAIVLIEGALKAPCYLDLRTMLPYTKNGDDFFNSLCLSHNFKISLGIGESSCCQIVYALKGTSSCCKFTCSRVTLI
jgi:hypothetical protein